MAGYYGYSKSNNAVDAEKSKRFPASVLARKLRVTTAAIKSLLDPCEWHHTSGWFNETDYYDGCLLITLANNQMPDRSDYYTEEEIFEAAELLLSLRNYKPPFNLFCQTCKKTFLATWLADLTVCPHCGGTLDTNICEKSKKEIYNNCTVCWLEWSGTRRRPRATERKEIGCTVEFNGKSTYTITLPNGSTFTKRKNTNGFSFKKGE